MTATLPFVAVGWLLATVSMPASPYAGRWWRVERDDFVLPRPGSRLLGLLGMAFLVGGLTLAVITYLPWALQSLHGMDATTIGSHLVPMLVAAAIGSAVGGALASRPCILTGCWVLLVAAVGVAAAAGPLALTVAAALAGLSCGAVLPVVLTRVQAYADPEHRTAASSLVQLARHGGAAVLVPSVGLWTTFAPATFAGLGLLASFTTVAACGLVLTRRSS